MIDQPEDMENNDGAAWDLNTLGGRMRWARKRAHMTQEALADKAGTSPASIVRSESNETRRSPALPEIAQVLGVSFDWLLNCEGPVSFEDAEELRQREASIQEQEGWVRVEGVAAAGLWREIDDLASPEEYEAVPLSRDTRFPGVRQFALRVEGQSMNKILPDGGYVLCIDGEDASGIRPRVGEIVAVERRRYQGQERELTIKQYGRVEGKPALLPCSTDPRFLAIIPMDDEADGDDDTEITIIGIVKFAGQLF